MTRREAFISAGLAIALGLAVAAFLMLGQSQLTEAIVLSMFPAALVAPTQWFYTRGHSRIARFLMIVLPLFVCFLIGLAAGIVVSD